MTLQDLIVDTAIRLRASFKKALNRRSSREAFAALANAYKDTARLQLLYMQSMQPMLACHTGCAHCCHTVVTPTIPEVLILANHLRHVCTQVQLNAIKERCRQYLLDVHNLSYDEWKQDRSPCPLLSPENRCLGYDVRPFICRAWTSRDATACERQKQQPGSVAVLVEKGMFSLPHKIESAVLLALRDTNRHDDAVMVSLPAALLIALEHKNPMQAWLAGEKLFANCIANAHDAVENQTTT
jgi:Fe-S-cluster containining protein